MKSKNSPASAVDQAAGKILEAFDRLGLARLASADLLAAAGDGPAARSALAGLTEAKYLRESLGQYERTEAGRLQIAPPNHLTLLSRSGCHLCEQALHQIEPIAARFSAPVRVVDIDADAVLRQRYDIHIPVLFLGAREFARHPFDLRLIENELSRLCQPTLSQAPLRILKRLLNS